MDYLGTTWQAQLFRLTASLFVLCRFVCLTNFLQKRLQVFIAKRVIKLSMAKGYQPLSHLEGQCAPTTSETVTANL